MVWTLRVLSSSLMVTVSCHLLSPNNSSSKIPHRTHLGAEVEATPSIAPISSSSSKASNSTSWIISSSRISSMAKVAQVGRTTTTVTIRTITTMGLRRTTITTIISLGTSSRPAPTIQLPSSTNTSSLRLSLSHRISLRQCSTRSRTQNNNNKTTTRVSSNRWCIQTTNLLQLQSSSSSSRIISRQRNKSHNNCSSSSNNSKLIVSVRVAPYPPKRAKDYELHQAQPLATRVRSQRARTRR